MGIFDLIKKQFISVISWTESDEGTLVYRFPMLDNQIQNGAQLTVRDTQFALFVNEGEIADLFGPGLYTLTTHTLPIMTSLKNWDKMFASPFKSDVYFFSTRDQLDQKWGTPNPVTIRDKDYGPIRIRANGNYSYKIKNPQLFYKKVSGSREIYTTTDIEGQLRSMVITAFGGIFGGSPISFVDMAANQSEFSNKFKEGLIKPFADYGLELQSFFVQSISLPEELQERFDKASSMRIVGNIGQYAQFQAADSISTAAANEGGLAGAGVGMGAGVAIGQSMAQGLSNASSASSAAKEDVSATLDKLFELVKKGVLTQDEFNAKKTELLKKIT